MFNKKHKLKLRILCAFMAFLVAFVHIPITTFAATDEVLLDHTVVISLDEILDKLIKTRGNGISVDGLDEEVRDEIGDAAIVMKGTESGITYLVVAYIMGEDSDMYRNKDKAEIINSILSLSVVFINKKDSEQEINFVFQSDDLCGYSLMEDLRTVKEPDSEKTESKNKTKAVETTQAETQDNSSEVSSQPSEESSDAADILSTEAAPETSTEPETQPSTEAVTEISAEPETLLSVEAAAETSTEPETQPFTEAETETPAEIETQSSTETAAEASTETQAQPSTETTAEASTETQAQPSTETAAEASTETQAQPSTETVPETSTEVSNSNSVLPEPNLASSDAITYQTPVESAVLATALDAASVPASVTYEGIGTFSNGSVRLLGKSAGAVDIQLSEATVSKRYLAYMDSYSIKIIDEDKDEEHLAYCYNSKKSYPIKKGDSYYIKYEYDNLPPDYTEHIENGSDVLGANQDVIAMLLTVGYPNDSRGYQKKHDLSDINAYMTTQFILHFILDPQVLINSFAPPPDNNGGKEVTPVGRLTFDQALERYLSENPYANDVYNAAIEGFSYDFSFDLEGDIVFNQADDGSYQTDSLTTKGTLNGYYEFETLPGNIRVNDLNGNDISAKRIELGEPFKFVSSTMPTKEESLGIRITCKHSTPTIYYYMSEDKNYQNLISLELSDSYETRKLNILDVIQPGDPDPENPEEPPVDPDPEPEIPVEIPDNNTPSGGGSGGGGPSGNTPDNNGPGPGTETETTIPDGGVPLAQLPPSGLPSDPELSLIEIDDGEVPLAPLPKTGQDSTAGKLFLFSSLLGGLWLIVEKSRKKNA